MKKWLLAICLLAFPTFAQAQQVELTDLPIDGHEDAVDRALTNEVINLYGPEAEAAFYYTLDADVSDNGYYAEFALENSSLLIEPSSVTVLVNNRPIQSVKLQGKTAQQIVVPLEGEALKAGVHEVRLQFSGFLVDGVCVDQNSSGNWLTIGINSYIHLPADSTNALQLSAYPEIFTGTKKHEITIIVPQNASDATLAGALEITSYITSISEDKTVKLMRESDVTSLKGNVILVGAMNEFSSTWAKKSVSTVDVEGDALMLMQQQWKNGDPFVYALVVTAKEAATIAEKAVLLTTETFSEQLAGPTLAVTAIPAVDEELRTSVTFKELGMANMTLNRLMTQTPTYYYYLPQAEVSIKEPTLDLHVKISDVITPYSQLENDAASLLQQQPVELIIMLNDVPHAVDLQSVDKTDNGDVRVTIPIDESIVENSQLLTVRVVGNGLRVQNPCIATDNDRWVYIYDDTRLTFPVDATADKKAAYFSRFPYPFIQGDVPLTIVKDETVQLEELVTLYSMLMTNRSFPNIQLTSRKDIKEADLQKGHVIVFGNPTTLPNVKADDMLVTYKDKAPQLEAQGFVPTNDTSFSFIQPSVWNNDYALAVFDKVPTAKNYVPTSLANYVRQTDAPVSMVVSNGPELIFTSKEHEAAAQEDENRTTGISTTAIVVTVLAVLLLLAVLLFFLYSRQKRKGHM